MIEGSDAVKIGSCGAIRPARALADAAEPRPQPELRPDDRQHGGAGEQPDRFVFVSDVQDRVLGHHLTEIAKKLTAGELEDAYQPSFWLVIGKYAKAHSSAGVSGVNSWGEVLSITMNLTQPPFDDVHVRRAMNWIIDRALRDAYGGPMAGRSPGTSSRTSCSTTS